MSTLLPLAVFITVYVPQAVLLAHCDGAEHRLPNRRVLMLTGTVTGALAACAVAVPTLRAPLWSALVLATALGVLAVVLALVAAPLLGMGDAKCSFVVVLMAATLGGPVLIAGTICAVLLAGGFGVAVMARDRRAGTAIPVGPVLLAVPALGLVTEPLLRHALGVG